MTCEAWPDVELSDGSVHRNGAAGYADALRSFVGDSVISADERLGLACVSVCRADRYAFILPSMRSPIQRSLCCAASKI